MEISYENNGIFVRKTMDSIGRMVSAEEADRLLRKYPGRYKVVWYGLDKDSIWVNLHLLGLNEY
jgi:hypothetical protein